MNDDNDTRITRIVMIIIMIMIMTAHSLSLSQYENELADTKVALMKYEMQFHSQNAKIVQLTQDLISKKQNIAALNTRVDELRQKSWASTRRLREYEIRISYYNMLIWITVLLIITVLFKQSISNSPFFSHC